MARLKIIFPLFFFLTAGLLTGCIQSSAPQARIIPTDCNLQVNQQVSLSLDGTIPQNARINWQVTAGSIVSSGLKVNAVFTAPVTAGDVTVSVIIDTGTPTPSITRTCTIIDPAVSVVAQNIRPTSSPGNTSLPGQPTVIISEVMAHQCGADDFKKFNQYVELYNPGEQAVDVNGWWLADNGPDNQSDRLVAWSTRNPNTTLRQSVVTDSTVILPHGFAVVISPIYLQSMEPYKMPYRFPSGTVILTVAEGDRIGDDVFGLVGSGSGRDIVVLYTGGSNSIQKVISTYGTPILGAYPQDLRDDRADNLPLDLHECASAERINPLGPDEFKNWREVLQGSPGEAPY
jgi:hypothetical protein